MAMYSKVAMDKFKPKQISEEKIFIHKLNQEILKSKEEAMKPKAKKKLDKLLSDIKVKIMVASELTGTPIDKKLSLFKKPKGDDQELEKYEEGLGDKSPAKRRKLNKNIKKNINMSTDDIYNENRSIK